jgi:hypothetical protein
MSSIILKKFTAITLFSIAMAFLEAAIVFYLKNKGIDIKISKFDLALGALAALLIFVSFVLDFPRIKVYQMPIKYHWELHILGELIGLFLVFRILFLRDKIRLSIIK